MTNEEILSKHIVGRIEPHIYAFETRTVPNYLKVGDTYRPVSVRLNEWRGVGYDKLILVYDEPATVGDRYFRDYAVHDYLQHQKGLKRLERETYPDIPYYSNEFFENAKPTDIDEAIGDIRTSAKNKDGRYSLFTMTEGGRIPIKHHYANEIGPYDLRPNQDVVVKRFIAARKHKRNNLLMYAVMRFGKSFTSLCCAKAMNADLVVVVSAKADVKTEWKKTVESLKNFSEYKFIDSDDLQRATNLVSEAKKQKQKLVVCLTLQDLSGKTLKERHRDLLSQRIDLLIVDETHYGARAKDYGKYLPSVNEIKGQKHKYDPDSLDDVEEQIRHLKVNVQLHLSGTPYRILMSNEFSDEDIICNCQFSDIVKASEDWNKKNLDKDEWENPYYGFPKMIRFGFCPNLSSLRKLEELKKSGQTIAFRELLAPKSIDKNPDGLHRQFQHEDEVLDLLKAIDGSQNDENILPFLDNDKIKQGKMCRHIVCVLPFSASCDSMEALLKSHAGEFKNLSQYEIINISSKEDKKCFSNNEKVIKYITDCESRNQKTITLTVTRMLTGVTVPEWDTMLFLKDASSPQEYDQAVFRLQSQYIREYKDESGKLIRYNMKPQTLLVDFDINRMFVLQEIRTHVYDLMNEKSGNTTLAEHLRRDLQVSPIIVMNKNRLQEVVPSNILDAVREYSSNRSVKDEALDVPVDQSLKENETLRKLIENQYPIGSPEGLSIKANNGKNVDDLDIPDPDPSQPISYPDPSKSKKKDTEEITFAKRFATLCTRILLYAFLTNDSVISLEDIVAVAHKGKDNKRILNNLGLDLDSLKLLYKCISPNVLRNLDYKIQNINTLSQDKNLNPVERVENAMRRFGRWSMSEVVTPMPLAKTMLSQIPSHRIAPDTRFMDIASKEGEFAYAIVSLFGNAYKDKVYSIPTSSVAYEFTRKVYEALEMPIENIEDKFNSYDLIGKNSKIHLRKIKKMEISIAVGNPPYQEQGGSGGSNDAPIFQNFCTIAQQNASQLSTLVIPSKWFTGGRESLLGPFRRDMLQSGQLLSLTAYHNPRELFPEVEIKGGLCYYVRDKQHNGVCNYSLIKNNAEENAIIELRNLDVLIREPRLSALVQKVVAQTQLENGTFVEDIISSDTPFGIPTNPTTSKKTPFDVREVNTEEFAVSLHYLDHNNRMVGYVRRDDIRKNANDIDSIKVFIPKAGGSGNDQLILGQPIVAMPPAVCSQTYVYAAFDTIEEANNFVTYLRTRFFRLLVSSMKITQDALAGVYHFVPMQDFNIAWTDEMLYERYHLTPEEINYIEEQIRTVAY